MHSDKKEQLKTQTMMALMAVSFLMTLIYVIPVTAENVFAEKAPKSVASMLRRKTVKVSYIKNKKGNRIEYGKRSGQKSKGYSIFQGSCSDGRYSYHVLYNKKKNTCKVIKVDPKNHRVIKVSPAYKMYHGNDIAYDTKRDRLVIVHGDGDTKRLSIMNPKTLKRKKVVKLSFSRAFKGASRKTARRIKGVTGIAYDDKNDQFICSVKSTFHYVALNKKFKPVRYIRTKTRGNLQKQGMLIVDGRILRVMNRYKGKKVVGNYIYSYSRKGTLKKRIRIVTGSEVESIYIYGKNMYASTYIEKRKKGKIIKRYSHILKLRKAG